MCTVRLSLSLSPNTTFFRVQSCSVPIFSSGSTFLLRVRFAQVTNQGSALTLLPPLAEAFSPQRSWVAHWPVSSTFGPCLPIACEAETAEVIIVARSGLLTTSALSSGFCVRIGRACTDARHATYLTDAVPLYTDPHHGMQLVLLVGLPR